MIAPLRRFQLRVFVVMAVLLAIGVPLMLSVRRPPASAETPAHPRAAEANGTVRSESGPYPEMLPMMLQVIQLQSDNGHSRAFQLKTIPLGPISEPDLLAYWSTHSDGTELPQDSIFIGRPSWTQSSRFPVPAAALESAGAVWLFSLGHDEAVGKFPVPRVADLYER